MHSKFVKFKNQKLKEFYHINYKTYRNLLSTLLKRAKEKYFTKFFNENIKNIKKVWIGIKSLVSLKHKAMPHHHSVIQGQPPPCLKEKNPFPLPPNFSHPWVPRILIPLLKWNFSSIATFKT